MRILSTDILVVGAGLAGFTAAIRAAEKGAKVILTDKSNGPFGDGNILMASGSLRAGGKRPRTSSKELYESVMSERVGYPDLVKAWSLTCGRALDWLISSGVKVNESAAGRVWLDQAWEVSLAPVYKKDVDTRALASRKKRLNQFGGSYISDVTGEKLIYESRPEKAHCNRPWKIKTTEKSHAIAHECYARLARLHLGKGGVRTRFAQALAFIQQLSEIIARDTWEAATLPLACDG